METGAPKRRRRFTSVPETFSFVTILTAEQYAALKTFVEVTLADVGLFDWVDMRTGEPATYYFKSRPSYASAGGGMWTAEIELVKK